jgi:hypothetical protein
VQKDHLHLIVEATNRHTFSSGMRSLAIRAARRLNGLFDRKGKVIRDRYHRRDLFTAKQVRNALVYVLLNGAKHKQIGFGKLDPFSSSFDFDGWRDVDGLPHATADPGPFPRAPEDPASRTAKTPLLDIFWREFGLLSVEESIRWMPPRGGIDVPPPEGVDVDPLSDTFPRT